MKENLLHFIWKLQLFSSKKMQTSTFENVKVVFPGLENKNSGPDFLNAKIRIDDQLWAGNIEIHLKSSDWYVHNHEIDHRYNAVVLHVVWEHDVEIFGKSNQTIATLELKNYISNKILESYEQLFNKPKKWIFCEGEIQKVQSFHRSYWFSQLYMERLEQKALYVQKILLETNNNWEATLFILLAKSFGLKVNGDAFENVGRSFDYSIVRKLSKRIESLEALFFGQAHLLESHYEDVYFKQLKTEYLYLRKKFELTPISKGAIQFFRLRPNNFPTIRLSQLAMLYQQNQHLFSKLIEVERADAYYQLFDVGVSLYWEAHYTFEKQSKCYQKKLTKSFVNLLLINAIIPLKFLYLKNLGKSDFSELTAVVEQINPEKNVIISKFNSLKIKGKNAFDTQALLQLKNEYCNKKRCLECVIGKELMTHKLYSS